LRALRRLLSPALRRPSPLDQTQLESALELVYRFILARPSDEEGRRLYLSLMHDEGMSLREVAAEIAASDEFQTRLIDTVGAAAGGADRQDSRDAVVDVRQLIQKLSVEDLIATAEDYYRNTRAFADRYLAKPFDDPHGTPELLGSFAQLLGGLRLAPDMTVLDFGAGVCWTTRALSQLGCQAIALDVSPTALDLGRQLYARMPPIGEYPPPRFMVFDGHRIDLPDASVDRIACFDAFHHVPNPDEVMRELGRVLRPGGIAGFSEPGPHQSTAPRAQYEMKNYIAIENDVVMDDVWRWARASGFAELQLAVFSTDTHHVSLADFNDVRSGGASLEAYTRKLRAFLGGHQTFFLVKGGRGARDSREREGLRGEISVRLERTELRAGEPIRGEATVQNVGTATWLPGATATGGVNLGVHLRFRDGRPITVDFARVALEGHMPPGDTRTVSFALPSPPAGDYLLEFDLVSERVGWFEMNASATATVAISVR
jgi:SAM-dependent methyltransferase